MTIIPSDYAYYILVSTISDYAYYLLVSTISNYAYYLRRLMTFIPMFV